MRVTQLREYAKPDVSAPRHRQKVTKMHQVPGIFDELRERKPLLKNYTDKQLKDIYKDFIKTKVVPYVENNREPLEFPFNMGHMFLGIYGKWSKGRVDHNSSADLGLEVHHRNGSTDGYGICIFWTISGLTSNHGFANNHMWGFKPAKKFIREANRKVRDDEGAFKRYMHIKNTKFIRRDVVLGERALKNAQKYKTEIEEYDEFSFD
jgi:mRNA-degrading endonuclease YafQ of YafQ-DinJ toxin-antitoxin module